MTLIYLTFLLIVAGIHLFFAYRQWFHWPDVCEALMDFNETEVSKTSSLGRSFASYNVAIGLGLILSLSLEATSQAWVQAVTLGSIVFSSAVGASGTKGHTILKVRLLPAAMALALLAFISSST